VFRRKRPNSVVNVAEMYSDLREMVLTIDPTEYDLPPVGESRLYGAVMELGYEETTATVLGLSDGTTSLYTTSGFGVIGGGAHEAVREATSAWLLEMSALVPDLSLASEVDPPATSDVQFIALTYDGHRVGQAREVTLQRGDAPLSSLYRAGHRVLARLHDVEEQHRRSSKRRTRGR
jgi:hypothetical protein